jgi:hypothetical protein
MWRYCGNTVRLAPLVRACTRLCMWSSEMRMCFNPQYLNPVLAGHARAPINVPTRRTSALLAVPVSSVPYPLVPLLS